jgi:hypothetical protein
MIFKIIKPLSIHIARHQSIWAQLVFKTTSSNIKEVSNALRTSKRRRRRRMYNKVGRQTMMQKFFTACPQETPTPTWCGQATPSVSTAQLLMKFHAPTTTCASCSEIRWQADTGRMTHSPIYRIYLYMEGYSHAWLVSSAMMAL